MGYRITPVGLSAAALGLLLAADAGAVDLFAPHRAPAPLPVDEAFRPLPPLLKNDQLKLEWDIAPGYYLYRSRLEVTAVAPADAHLGALALPAGLPHHDEQQGDDQIYRNDLTATAGGAAKITRVRLRYQGCADIGLCYPPQEKEFDVTADKVP